MNKIDQHTTMSEIVCMSKDFNATTWNTVECLQDTKCINKKKLIKKFSKFFTKYFLVFKITIENKKTAKRENHYNFNNFH